MGPMEPVRALCDLRKNIDLTTTQINNTKYIDEDVATKSGSNDLNLNYAASIIQMRELIMNSASCEQYIKFTCHGAPLFRSPEGPPAVIIFFIDYFSTEAEILDFCKICLTMFLLCVKLTVPLFMYWIFLLVHFFL